MKNTQEITVTVLKQTITALEEYEKMLELSKGEIIDRLALNGRTNDPKCAAITTIDYMLMLVYSQDEKQVETTAYKIMAYLYDMLTSLNGTDLETVMKNVKNEYNERIAVMEKRG